MNKLILALAPVVIIAGCNTLQWNSDILGGGSAHVSQIPQTDPQAPLSAISTDAFPGNSIDSPAVVSSSALPPVSGAGAARFQGRANTVASLGDPGLAGMWMETSLVSSDQLARLRNTNGKEVIVTLMPAAAGAGSGGRLSISAMRALGVPLTELVELEVLPAG